MLRLFPLLLGCGLVLGCDRGDVVAATFHYQTAGARADEAGAGGQPDVPEPSAGMGGASSPPPCTPANWYYAAQVVEASDCKLPRNTESYAALFWLLFRLPLPASDSRGESRPLSSCDIEYWLGMRTAVDDTTPLQVCDRWCTHILNSYFEEQDRLSACMQAGMP